MLNLSKRKKKLVFLIKYVPPSKGQVDHLREGHVVVSQDEQNRHEVILRPQKGSSNFRLLMKLRELHEYHKTLQELKVAFSWNTLALKLSETDIDYDATKGILDFWEAVNIKHDIKDIDGVFSDQAESLLLAHIIEHLVRHVSYSVLFIQASLSLASSSVQGASVLTVLDDTRGWVALLPLDKAMGYRTTPYPGLPMLLDVDAPVIHLISESLYLEVNTYEAMCLEVEKAGRLLSSTGYPLEYLAPFLDERREMLYNSIHSLVSEG